MLQRIWQFGIANFQGFQPSSSGNVFGEISHIRRVIWDKSTTLIANDCTSAPH
jgi:hypothetical protein